LIRSNLRPWTWTGWPSLGGHCTSNSIHRRYTRFTRSPSPGHRSMIRWRLASVGRSTEDIIGSSTPTVATNDGSPIGASKTR
jgi:hypothetical protein